MREVQRFYTKKASLFNLRLIITSYIIYNPFSSLAIKKPKPFAKDSGKIPI